MNDLERLQGLIGQPIDYNDIICSMTDEEEEVIVKKSENNGYDYIAYYDYPNSTEYLLMVDKNDCIIDVIEK